MSVSLLDLSRGASARALSMTAETAGYLILAVIDAGGLRQCTALSDMVLLETGEVRLGQAQLAEHAGAPERDLRALLARLLAMCSAAHPILSEVSRAERFGTLARELETALIPVNRAAARRTLARACRETERAKRAGKLNDVVLDPPPPAPAQPTVSASVPALAVPPAAAPVVVAPAAAAPASAERRRQPRTVVAAPSPPVVAEHTVRIDRLRPALPTAADDGARRARNAAVADRRLEPRPTGRRLDDVRAPLERVNKTPFLGSVVTEMRDQVLEHDTQIDAEVAPVEPFGLVASALPPQVAVASVDSSQPLEVPVSSFSASVDPILLSDEVLVSAEQPAVAEHIEPEAEPVSIGDERVAITQTPPWQPSVQPVRVAGDDKHSSGAEQVSDNQGSSSEPEPSPVQAPVEEMEGFFLLLDDAASSRPPSVAVDSAIVDSEQEEAIESESQPVAVECVDECVDEVMEVSAEDLNDEPDPSIDAPPIQERMNQEVVQAPLYQPRRTDVTALLADFEPPNVEQDVAHELKLMAGIEASASSQTPPPVGFSEVSEPPLLTAGTPREPGSAPLLSRAKAVGLATLTGMGLALVLLRVPQQNAAERSLASREQQRCTASLKVVDASVSAEVRIRAPAPNAGFAPLAARGPTALFPQLPCGTALEVLIRDSANVDSGWLVIPIAPEELSAHTVLEPLRVSVQTR